jgi:hypothetical protein
LRRDYNERDITRIRQVALLAGKGAKPLPVGEHRCAQPPYDTLPIPRADIPVGFVLSRDATDWIDEGEIEDIALPLYEGRMVGQFDFSQKGWVSGKGRKAVWREMPWSKKQIEPQYLMGKSDFEDDILTGWIAHIRKVHGHEVAEAARQELRASVASWSRWWRHRMARLTIMDVTSSTNARTTIAAMGLPDPHGHKTPVLKTDRLKISDRLILLAVMDSFVFDWLIRFRLGGMSLVWAVLTETGIPRLSHVTGSQLSGYAASLAMCDPCFAVNWLQVARESEGVSSWKQQWALTTVERLRYIAIVDCLVAEKYGIGIHELLFVLRGCAFSEPDASSPNPNGFWRVDKDLDPERRQTVLTLVAFHDLQQKIQACGGDRDKGIEAFLSQNNGEGWMLPETLRLADYGLGHDDRAKEPQPVASRLGPRFYDWQLAQSPEESWRECELHARNLLGEVGYQALLADIEREKRGEPETETPVVNEPPAKKKTKRDLIQPEFL